MRIGLNILDLVRLCCNSNKIFVGPAHTLVIAFLNSSCGLCC
jgi:hypothetical protein